MKHLILGGARSGKSRFAEQQALSQKEKSDQQLWYVATATVEDSEMSERIRHHQERRDNQWRLIEEPLNLASIINQHNSDEHCILIDCLTLWITNGLIKGDWLTIKKEFIRALQQSQANIFLVSNEVGSGVVPMGELSRQFVDQSGWLHQELAELCEEVTLVVAGLPQTLKKVKTESIKN